MVEYAKTHIAMINICILLGFIFDNCIVICKLLEVPSHRHDELLHHQIVERKIEGKRGRGRSQTTLVKIVISSATNVDIYD